MAGFLGQSHENQKSERSIYLNVGLENLNQRNNAFPSCHELVCSMHGTQVWRTRILTEQCAHIQPQTNALDHGTGRSVSSFSDEYSTITCEPSLFFCADRQ